MMENKREISTFLTILIIIVLIIIFLIVVWNPVKTIYQSYNSNQEDLCESINMEIIKIEEIDDTNSYNVEIKRIDSMDVFTSIKLIFSNNSVVSKIIPLGVFLDVEETKTTVVESGIVNANKVTAISYYLDKNEKQIICSVMPEVKLK